MDKMTIYNHLPIWGQNLACFFEGNKIVKTRYGNKFWEKLKEYEERSTWTYDQLCAYRDSRIQKLIMHSYNTVPYYKRLFDDGGIDPKSIVHIDDLKRLPILTKDIIKKNPKDFISSAIKPNEILSFHTSGTTGNGFIFSTTQDTLCEQWAVWWRYRRAIGIEYGDWCALLGGRSVVPISQLKPPFFRWNKPCKQLYFSTYHMNDNNLQHYVNAIKRYKLNWIHGYPSAINLLADYMIQHDQMIDIKYITTGAENLLESQKQKIKIAFGHDPYEHYGLSEGTANFSEKSDHTMFVDEDFAAVEFLEHDDNSSIIIGTSLTNYVMPFIRYNTGDTCVMRETSKGRQIISIDGRKEDYLILRDGTKVGRLDHIFKDMVNVREAQFVQLEPGFAKLKIVKTESFSKDDEEILLQEIYSRLKNIDIKIEYVETIPRTKSGKFRFVIKA